MAQKVVDRFSYLTDRNIWCKVDVSLLLNLRERTKQERNERRRRRKWRFLFNVEYARPKPVLANDHRFHQKWRWNEKGRFVVCVSAHRLRFSISSENEPDRSSRIYRSRSISAISWPYRLMHSTMFVAPSARACEKHTVILPFNFLSSFAMTGSGRISFYIHYCIYHSFIHFILCFP